MYVYGLGKIGEGLPFILLQIFWQIPLSKILQFGSEQRQTQPSQSQNQNWNVIYGLNNLNFGFSW